MIWRKYLNFGCVFFFIHSCLYRSIDGNSVSVFIFHGVETMASNQRARWASCERTYIHAHKNRRIYITQCWSLKFWWVAVPLHYNLLWIGYLFRTSYHLQQHFYARKPNALLNISYNVAIIYSVPFGFPMENLFAMKSIAAYAFCFFFFLRHGRFSQFLDGLCCD